VKAPSNFLFGCGGDHVLDDGSDIEDGSFYLVLFGGLLPRKKRPPRRLHAFETERYDTLLWMCKIMPEE
jgi:hypothetical protein